HLAGGLLLPRPRFVHLVCPEWLGKVRSYTTLMLTPSRSDLDDVRQFLLYAAPKVIQQAMERLRVLDHGQLATAVEHGQPGTGGRGAEGFPVVQGDNAIQTPPDEEGVGTNALHLACEVRISARPLYQAGHQPTALPLPLELWPAAHVLPLGAEPVGLRCSNKSQPAKYRLGKGLLIERPQVRGRC